MKLLAGTTTHKFKLESWYNLWRHLFNWNVSCSTNIFTQKQRKGREKIDGILCKSLVYKLYARYLKIECVKYVSHGGW